MNVLDQAKTLHKIRLQGIDAPERKQAFERKSTQNLAKYVAGKWRGYWDFDSGAKLLDWGAHTLDLCQWANDADDTLPIEYEPTDKNFYLMKSSS